MAGRENSFEYESLQDAESIVSYLNALADGIKCGRLSLSSNGRMLNLEPNGLIRLGVEAKRGKHRSRLIVKVDWRDDEREDRGDQLRIGSSRS